MNQIRQEKMLDFIRNKEFATIKQLRELYPEVSLMTIHRDLNSLAALGEIVKLRGGVRTVSHSMDPVLSVRAQENLLGKALIAQKALELIRPGSSVFLDAGTTSLAVAKILPDIPLSVFTTGPNISVELSRLTKPSIVLCGGSLNKDNLAISGHSTLETLKNINIDLAFIGVSGCSSKNGFTCGKESEMLVKQLAIKISRVSAVLCDRSKFTRLMPFTFARIGDVDYIVTDGTLPDAVLHEAKKEKTQIL